jgi:hypothetical protein
LLKLTPPLAVYSPSSSLSCSSSSSSSSPLSSTSSSSPSSSSSSSSSSAFSSSPSYDYNKIKNPEFIVNNKIAPILDKNDRESRLFGKALSELDEKVFLLLLCLLLL